MKVVRNKTYPEASSTTSSNSVMVAAPTSLETTSIGTFPYSFMDNSTDSSTGTGLSGGTFGGIDARSILQQLLTIPRVAEVASSNPTNSVNNESLVSSIASAFLGEGDRDLSFFHQMVPPQQHQEQALHSPPEAMSTYPPAANLLHMNIPTHQTTQAQVPVSALLSLLCNASSALSQQQLQQPPVQNASIPVRNASSDIDESSDSNTRSSNGGDGVNKFDPLIFKTKALREEALRRGSRILLCRARGMPMNHSANVSQLGFVQ
jgi:hypothetical protein